MRLIVTIILSLNFSFAYACNCNPLSIGERVVSSDIVTVANVVKANRVCLNSDGDKCYGPVTFVVKNKVVLKGDQMYESEALFISDLGSCSFYLPKVGTKLLIFGKQANYSSDTYTTGWCSGNEVLTKENEKEIISNINTFLDVYHNDQELSIHNKQINADK